MDQFVNNCLPEPLRVSLGPLEGEVNHGRLATIGNAHLGIGPFFIRGVIGDPKEPVAKSHHVCNFPDVLSENLLIAVKYQIGRHVVPSPRLLGRK